MKVKAWLVLRSVRTSYGGVYRDGPYKGQDRIDSIRVVKVTQSKPTLDNDQICFQIDMDVDEAWFLDGTATIKASVPAPPEDVAEIQATVDMPVKHRPKSEAARKLGL